MNFDPSSIATTGAIALFTLSAAGSALGSGLASSAAIGAWKKCFAQNKPAPFNVLTFVGAAMTNTLYGMVLMIVIIGKVNNTALSIAAPAAWALLAVCVFIGLIIGLAAWTQARASACACDAQCETGQGFANYLAAVGIIEGVTIFVFIFSLLVLDNFFKAVP